MQTFLALNSLAVGKGAFCSPGTGRRISHGDLFTPLGQKNEVRVFFV